MKIILHGATSGSNFGDFLFADLFYNKLNNVNYNGENIFFEFSRFGIRSYFKKELNYTNKQKFKDLRKADLLVLFSGGYFGEREGSLKENILRFVRYVPISFWFILRKKPIVISGVGGGPLTSKLLRKSMAFIMKKSLIVTVRDEQTKAYFKEYGVKRNIIVTSDTAQTITKSIIPPLDHSVENDIENTFSNKKKIFLHLYGKENIDNKIIRKVIAPLNDFLSNNKDYGVVIGFDWKKNIEPIRNQLKGLISCDTTYFYKYEDPWQFCSLLNNMNVIITPKLHVGIIGATFSKSVISLPMHREKTIRYYQQIGESERCISLNDSTYNDVRETLNKFHNKNINLSKEILSMSEYNLKILEKINSIINEKK